MSTLKPGNVSDKAVKTIPIIDRIVSGLPSSINGTLGAEVDEGDGAGGTYGGTVGADFGGAGRKNGFLGAGDGTDLGSGGTKGLRAGSMAFFLDRSFPASTSNVSPQATHSEVFRFSSASCSRSQ